MIIEMQKGATEKDIRQVVKRVKENGFDIQMNQGKEKTIVAVLGSGTESIETQIFEVLPGVEKVIRIMKPYKLASRDFEKENTIVEVGNVKIGGNAVVIMAGPCSVESKEQIISCAKIGKSLGAKILRGGAFKPRTSPFAFQGLKEEGLKLLAKAKEETGLLIITEIVAPEDVPLVAEYSDILQIGTRNMQNYRLLEAAGKSGKPVLLKRGFSATLEEWLTAADYLLRENNPNVILCERGIRTFSNSTRFTLDLGIVPVVKKYTHLPIIVDPSHAAGHWEYVPSLSKAAIAAGADGILIEIHPQPKKALSDGPQSLTFSDFSRLMAELKLLAKAVGREI
ncbi:MAG: 3-deoxy-7-phosphoheptulonate synthase [Candidatus Pacebacteria bacterium]|nr:3-deoxy-7-phosphoheptulonate synthase [Candidatus Paceibacterota bacterium]